MQNILKFYWWLIKSKSWYWKNIFINQLSSCSYNELMVIMESFIHLLNNLLLVHINVISRFIPDGLEELLIKYHGFCFAYLDAHDWRNSAFNFDNNWTINILISYYNSLALVVRPYNELDLFNFLNMDNTVLVVLFGVIDNLQFVLF